MIGKSKIFKIVIFFTTINMECSENTKNTIDNTSIHDMRKQIKNTYKDILKLKEGTTYEDKETLETFTYEIVQISNFFDGILNDTNMKPTKNFFDEKSLENMKKNITIMRDSIESIKEAKETRENKRLMQECIEELKRKNYRLAVNKVRLINDHKEIEKIVNIVYDGDKNNFNNIRKFGEEIPSISLSLIVYKSLMKEIEKESEEYFLNLDLIESIKIQVYDQIAVDSATKNEAEEILYKLKNPVRKWIAEKLGKAVMNDRSEKELNDIIERIVYGMNDFQFFREIADEAVVENFPKNGQSDRYFENLFNLNSDKKELPQLIMYQSLFDYIYPNPKSFSKAYQKLIELHLAIKIANQNERKEFKNISDQMIKNGRDIITDLTKLISYAFIHRFYDEKSFDDLAVEIFLANADLFYENILKKSLEEIFGKISTVDVIKMMRSSSNILLRAIGFVVIYDKMKESKVLELKPENIGALLQLEDCVMKTLETPIPYQFYSLLKNVENEVKGTKQKVSNIFTYGLLKGNYATDDYKTLCLQIYDSENFGFFINIIAHKYFPKLGYEKLLDYVLSFPRFEERLVGLQVLQFKTEKNSVHLFEIAESHKKLMAEVEYDGINSFFKNAQEKYIKMFPSSIRNAVFAKEVYIKNMMEGGEYLYASFDTNKTNVYTRASWKRGNNTKWKLEKTRESGVYKIKNVQFDEYLYAQFEKNRHVFLGNKYINGNKWRFIPIDGGLYLKNMMHSKYLCAGSLKDKESRLIYKCMNEDGKNRGIWKIEDATTDY